MKKSILVSALALAVAAGAGAQKTADELRVYINPGHGSWTANDRPCTLVGHGAYSRTNTDTLSFFESNTNLRKGFAVLERLKSYGLTFDETLNQTGENWQIGAARDLSNNIVMSHVKLGPYHDDNGTESQLGTAAPADLYYYNRSLSEINTEVEDNDFDLFISIHSNAATEGTSTNYPLFLYRGYDKGSWTNNMGIAEDFQEESWTVASKCWPYAIANKFGYWTAYNDGSRTNLRGDVSFYGSGSANGRGQYGYLGVLKHGVPGFLVEGYFHTYQPARHRAMNWDVCYIEGDAYAHGIADYLGLEKEKGGTIYGVVRDQHEKFTDDAYTPNPTTNDLYKPLNGATVVLKKGEETVDTYTTDNYYNGAFVFRNVEPGAYTLVVTHPDYKETDPVEVTVTELCLEQPEVFLESTAYEPPSIVYENYPDPVAGSSVKAADEYAFTQTYVDEPVEALAGKTPRRVIARDGKLYILAHNEAKEPTIVVYDATNKAVLAEVSTEGTQGTEKAVADIQLTQDGVLLACNKNLNHYDDSQVEAGETRGLLRVYKWANDENGLPQGNPEEWFTSKLSANMYRAYAGETMAYNGTLDEGKMLVTVSNFYDNKRIWFNLYTIVGGQMVSQGFNNKPDAQFNEANYGTDYTIDVAPGDDNAFVISSSAMAPIKADWNLAQTLAPLADGVANGAAQTAYFRYAGHNYMAYGDNADGKNAGVKLADLMAMSDGKAVVTTNTAIAEGAYGVAAGEGAAEKDAFEAVTAGYINLYAVRDGKVSRFTTQATQQPVFKQEYAYDLVATPVADSYDYNISFKMTGDVSNANIVFTPVESGEPVVVAYGAAQKGANTYVVREGDLAEGVAYNWAVEVTNKANATVGEVAAYDNGLSNTRGGVAVFKDPEFKSFGKFVTTYAGAAGGAIYDAEGNVLVSDFLKGHSLISASGAANNSSPMAASAAGDEVYLASWGDTSYGIIAVDVNAENHADAAYSVFEGTKASSGLISKDGVGVGSGTPGVGTYLDEEGNLTLYSFDEDLVGNKILRYDFGKNKTFASAPSANLGQMGLANTNVRFVATKDGFFAAQTRGAGNNSDGCPSFLYSSKDGKLLFSSHVLADHKSSNSSIGANRDFSKLAVGQADKVTVYNVTWTDGVPSLTVDCEVAVAANEGNLDFDYAGNLYYYRRNGNGLHVYALTSEGGKLTVPAPKAQVLTGASAVEDIVVDEADEAVAPAVYYNINGVRVASDNLTPGVYVKVQGKKATKVVVK